MLLVLLVLAALLLSKANTRNEVASNHLEHDLSQLWGWSDEILVGGAADTDWHLRWRVSVSDTAEFERLSEDLFATRDGEPAPKTVLNGGSSVQGEWRAGQGLLSLHLVEETDKGAELLVMLDRSGDGNARLTQLISAAKEISNVVSGIGATSVETGIKAHGFASGPEAAGKLERLSQARLLEEYRDKGTVSYTYRSAILQASQSIGGGRNANIQIALHQNTERTETEITLGVPLITGEFGESMSASEQRN